MKRIKPTIMLLLLMLLILSSCTKVVSETYEVIPVVIVDAAYTPAFTTTSAINGKIQTHYHAASGYVEIAVKGHNEILGGVTYYERFSEYVGEEVWAINRIRVYDNDRIKETVISVFQLKEQAERILNIEMEDKNG